MRSIHSSIGVAAALLSALCFVHGNLAFGQSCSHPGFQSALRVLNEYSDVSATCKSVDMDDWIWEYVDIQFDDIPSLQTFMVEESSVLIQWKAYLTSDVVWVQELLEANRRNPSDFWTIRLDKDGDVEFEKTLVPLDDEFMESQFLVGGGELVALLSEHAKHGDPIVDAQRNNETNAMREEVVTNCIRGVLGPWEGMTPPEELNPRGYCECIADKMDANPEMMVDIFNLDAETFAVMIDGCTGILMPGMENFSVDDIEGLDLTGRAKSAFIRGCKTEALETLADQGLTDASLADEYCSCMFDELQSQGDFSMDDFEDMNSVVMTELDAACGHLLLGGANAVAHEYWNQQEGCRGMRTTPFVVNSGGGVKVKVSFGDIEKYFTLDSGCSEVILNEELAKSLKIAGIIGPGDYLGLEIFTLADGRDVAVEKYRVSQMKVGSCILYDFVVGVIEEGGMLLGMGYLSLFEAWQLDQSAKTLRTMN